MARTTLPVSLTAAAALAAVLSLVPLASVAANQPGSGTDTGMAGEQKVVIIVGPTGGLTGGFRAEAEAAARIARQWTSDVTTIYSPNATWARVRPALQDADVVIYMGHGNGFPSPYRNSPYAASQNGMALNSAGGSRDGVHRHYGERYLARQVTLAPDAIVLLHHLCYAAGNSEPGHPAPTADVARQRVENYAAGWLAAGAVAVVAEAYSSPLHYIRKVLASDEGIGSIWLEAPSFNDNVRSAASTRNPDALALLDPSRGGRYERALVLANAAGATPGEALGSAFVPDESRPLSFAVEAQPELRATAGQRVQLTISLANDGSVGWQPPVETEGSPEPDPFPIVPLEPARLEARLTPFAADSRPLALVLTAVAPGSQSELVLDFVAPAVAGEYSLTFDVVTPSFGSLVATGVEATTLRLSVAGEPPLGAETAGGH